MSRVFFVQKSDRFDTGASKKFGEPVFVLGSDVSPFNPDMVMLTAASRMKELRFDPDEDFVAFTGQSILLALFFGLVLTGWPRVSVLLFDARVNEYRPRVVTSPFELDRLG